MIESHKREALPHYQGGRGYQPTAVLWAEQDLAGADQFRDGTVQAGMHPPAVARRAVAAGPAPAVERAFRGDSACYDEKLLKYLVGQGIAFTISADMTVELHRVCTAPGIAWQPLEQRRSERWPSPRWSAPPGDWPTTAAPLRYLALRIRPRQGSLFVEGPTAALVQWHGEKAGTIEARHDVTKNELALVCCCETLRRTRTKANSVVQRDGPAAVLFAASARHALPSPPNVSRRRVVQPRRRHKPGDPLA